MLRITKIAQNSLPVILKLEGKISDQWASLLEGECRALLREKKTVHLDFSGVDFMDDSGVEMVRNLPRTHIRILYAPDFIQELLHKGDRS